MFEIDPIVLAFSMFIGLLIGLLLGHPLGFVLGGLSVIFGLIGWGPVVFYMFIIRIHGVMDNLLLVAVPMFIFMANLLQRSGVADAMFDSMRYLMGPVRGGVALAVIIVCTVFAATTGIIAASVTAMGLIALPVLLRYGYDKSLAAGTICAGGTLGILIPPSIMLILMADLTGLSVGKLFLGCVAPGLVLSLLYLIYIAIRCSKRPELALPLEERRLVPVRKRLTMASISLVPTLLLIIGVLGAIFTGIATPTEASGVGAFLALVLSIAYRRFSWGMFREAVIATGKTVSMVMIIVIGATCFTGVFLGLGGGQAVTDFILELGLGKWGTLAVMMFIVFILGFIIDWVGILFIVLPIFLPIAVGFGFDPVWFTVILAVNLQNSMLTPPFGFALFYLKGVALETLTTMEIYRGIVPFVILMLVGLVICILIPDLILVPANWIK